MKRLPLPLFVAAASFAWSPGILAQDARDEILLHDQVTLKLVAEPPAPATPWQDDIAGTGDPDLDAALQAAGDHQVRRVFREPPRGWSDARLADDLGLARWIAVDWDLPVADVEALRAGLEQLAAVEIADLVIEGYVADTVPNDPDFNLEWGLQNGRINAPRAWDIATDSTHIVAVIDTGTDLDHQDLVDNMWINTDEIANNGIDDDNNGFVDDRKGWDFYYDDRKPNDRFGHGVHCQGTVGATTDNNRQVAGVCWSVPVMSVKIFSDGGAGTHAISAAGLVYAADNGASVFSMSWGFFDSQQVLKDAVDYAAGLDVVQVAAAHNFGSKTEMYPAAYRKVMGIIATDENDNKTSWSNYGPWCDMAAPGNNVFSTYLNDGTAYLSGTSMSTPHVAGAAALVREVNPQMDRTDARRCLTYSATDLGSPGFDDNFGWGRLDLHAAVLKAQSLSVSQTEANPGDAVTIDLRVDSEAGYLHVLLPSRLGREPGTSMNGFDPSDFRQAAINPDWLLWNLLFAHPSGFGVFQNFIGNLDGSGLAQATLQLPGGNLFSGETFALVGFTFDPADVSQVSSITVSNTVSVK